VPHATKLTSLEQERWASPVRRRFAQALLDKLRGASHIVEAERAAAAAPRTHRLELRRFDSVAGARRGSQAPGRRRSLAAALPRSVGARERRIPESLPRPSRVAGRDAIGAVSP
jgi:hypothetical protein